MKSLVILALLGSAVAVPAPGSSQRIVGGSEVTVDHYPSMAAMLFGFGNSFSQICGSTILNQRAVLTAAHCYAWSLNPANYRVRVGSTFANSGGTVHAASQLISHPSFSWATLDSDIAIIRLATLISYNNFAQAAPIAGTNYIAADNQAVWATGWGHTQFQGQSSEHLRHVQVFVVNQDVCRARYAELGDTITDNMLCSGFLDVGGRDQCQGDSGGPLYHNTVVGNVVVGVCSWGEQCALARYPGVNVRVSRFTTWIQANASAANPDHYRVRVGSTFANSDGVVHAATQIIIHPSFDWFSVNYNIAIIRLASVISFNTYTQLAAIAGSNYNLADNQAVWAAGWGYTEYVGQPSEHLRHVQVFVVNQAVCTARYAELGSTVTDHMLCSKVLDVEGRDQCLGERGSPLYHNNVVVGVYSWGIECAQPRYPSVSTRISSFTPWI